MPTDILQGAPLSCAPLSCAKSHRSRTTSHRVPRHTLPPCESQPHRPSQLLCAAQAQACNQRPPQGSARAGNTHGNRWTAHSWKAALHGCAGARPGPCRQHTSPSPQPTKTAARTCAASLAVLKRPPTQLSPTSAADDSGSGSGALPTTPEQDRACTPSRLHARRGALHRQQQAMQQCRRCKAQQRCC